MLESLIDGHALEKPKSIAFSCEIPRLISSFILSKIKIFASTATPIESINPAMPARLRVTGIALKSARNKKCVYD